MRNRRPTPWTKLSVGLIVVGLLATSCSGDDDQEGSVESATPSSSAQQADAASEAATESDGSEGESEATPTSAAPEAPSPDAGGDNNDADPLEPLWGVVFDRSPEGLATDAQIAQMQELGIGYAKFWVAWNETEQALAAYNATSGEFGIAGDNQPTDLTRELLTANPGWIEEYAFPERPDSRFHDLIDWSRLDAQVDQLVAAGIAPLPLIADATTAPRIPDPDGPAKIAPEPLDFRGETGPGNTYAGVGTEAYLAHVELYAAAAARRYSESPRQITWWNLENELNFAHLHVQIFGWRTGDAWLDDAFRTELLETLSQGIKLGSPNARATHNVNFHDPNWAEDLARYADSLDALGLGGYPNYVSPLPLNTEMLTDAVETAFALGEQLGKPVFVLETGNPSGPVGGGWNEELQSEYVSIAPVDALNAGATGYFHFLLNDRDWDNPEGDLQQVEIYWGLVRVDGTYKPSFEDFQDVIAE
ncbi:MAG: hypothetical protein ACI9C1_001042 [Candidatus Aldehydirespiratoraceae bacterium]|jgi:hypothetical protein